MTRTLNPLREMDRLLNDVMHTPSSVLMPLDLYRTGDTFVAHVDMPGVDPASLDIDVDDRVLTIRAERKTKPAEQVKWLAHERPTGSMARQLTLGRGLATDRIEAQYTDGVLTLTIPVAEEAKPRKVTVKHATGGQSAQLQDA